MPTEAVDLNLASIGVSELAGSQTITRTVTSVVEDRTRRFKVQVDAPAGYEVSVSPDNIKLQPGESATYTVTITNLSAPIGEWRHGSLTWKAGRYKVRSPISVKGASLATPADVTGSGVDNGSAVRYDVKAEGPAALLIELPPDAVASPDIDLDVFVNDESGNLVANSTSGGTDESIYLPLPADGVYSIYVHGWQTVGPSADFDFYTWLVSATPGGNLGIDSAPASAVTAAEGTVEFSWTGAAAGQWHRGAISNADVAGLLGLTLVEVDNR